nr:hypothetical protein [Tanacetum cinerariifolium]
MALPPKAKRHCGLEPLRRLCHRLIAFSIAGREQSLQTLIVEVCGLTTIDMDELVRLRIYDRLGDVVTWVALGPPRTGPQRLQRLEKEVHRLGESLGDQRVLLERLTTDHERFSGWMVDRMTQLIQKSGIRYPRFDGNVVGTSHLSYKIWRFRQRTDGPSTSATPQTKDQPDP